MKIFHQTGHNGKWNRESFQKNGIGDGLIISPVHSPKEKVEGYDPDLKTHSAFDPQFYVPDSQKSNLHTYHFFPEKIVDGFSTNDFEASAHESAQHCLEFQIENDFEFLIVPARFHDQMVSNYVERQRAFSVDPFLTEINRIKTKKNIFVSLPLTASMLVDAKFRTKILNWVTSYQEIHGVYLMVHFDEISKQIVDFEKLNAYFSFVKELKEAGLLVLCGYCNTEGLLLSAFEIFGVTIGAYENTRRFSIDKFLDDDSEKRGPAPRIYLPNLLNWVRYDTIVEIKDDHPELWKKIYTPTIHSETMFNSGGRPHFTKPYLYHHHFELIYSQYVKLEKLASKSDKIAELQRMIETAHSLYSEIEKARVFFFDENCKGEHLPIWNRLLKRI